MRRNRTSQRGMTLVELVVGTALLVGGGGALLMGMQYAMIHANYLNDFQLAMDAVQSRLEELSATSFNTLLTDPTFAAAQTPAGQCMGLNEDRLCTGQLAGQDLNGNNVLDEPIPGARLNIRIAPFPPGTTDPTLLTLYVSACWSSRGRAIGQDLNCTGVLDAGEDLNGNGWLDSPAMASTRLADND